MPVSEGVDPLRLDQAGWGVIFAYNANPGLREALQPLIDLRRQQAGELFRIFAGRDGCYSDETAFEFLTRHGARPGPADTERVPYYLLLVGDPIRVPFSFQSQIGVQHAAGRLHFDALEEYARYADHVVAVETGRIRQPRRAAFFGVANDGDPVTQLGAEKLVGPLGEAARSRLADWQVSLDLGHQATKSRLSGLLGGDQTPAVLFAAGHGMAFPVSSTRQQGHQGALLCQDWPGPGAWRGRGAVPQDFYFAADDLHPSADLHGMIAFLHASYALGAPLADEAAPRGLEVRTPVSIRPLVAQLPCKMLSHPGGGALAVIGPVDRLWGYSFQWDGIRDQTAAFESCLFRLFDGYPLGLALEPLRQRFAELAADLNTQLEDIRLGKPVDPYDLAGLWTAANDLRSCLILGDPAVRLPAAADQRRYQQAA